MSLNPNTGNRPGGTYPAPPVPISLLWRNNPPPRTPLPPPPPQPTVPPPPPPPHSGMGNYSAPGMPFPPPPLIREQNFSENFLYNDKSRSRAINSEIPLFKQPCCIFICIILCILLAFVLHNQRSQQSVSAL